MQRRIALYIIMFHIIENIVHSLDHIGTATLKPIESFESHNDIIQLVYFNRFIVTFLQSK